MRPATLLTAGWPNLLVGATNAPVLSAGYLKRILPCLLPVSASLQQCCTAASGVIDSKKEVAPAPIGMLAPSEQPGLTWGGPMGLLLLGSSKGR